MSKPICLLFALVILTTILCNNSVCSQRRSWKQVAVCGCKIHPMKGLQCRHNLKREFREIVRCICRHPEIYLDGVSEKQFIRMCTKSISIPL